MSNTQEHLYAFSTRPKVVRTPPKEDNKTQQGDKPTTKGKKKGSKRQAKTFK